MSKIIIDEATVKLALEALENSVDLVREDAYQAEKLYGNYQTRQGKVNGLKVLADDHEKAITAIKEALAEQPAQRTWVGLTEYEKSYALQDKDGITIDYEDYADAIEAKLKEKNT